MDPLAAVVAVCGALLTGGGIVGVLTARSSSRKLGAEAEKATAEADRTTVEAIGSGYGAFVDRLERALARCETHALTLEEGIRQLRETALEAREAALALKERVDTIEREQPAQQQAAVKEAVGEVVRGLGALDPNQHEEGAP